MNKQEILDEINKTKEHLADLEKRLEECKYERWKPEEGDTYYLIDHSNEVYETEYRDKYDYCKSMYSTYNCFKTKKEAEQEAEKILVRRMLEDIARRLNKGKKIDWKNSNQDKYYIVYCYEFDELAQFSPLPIGPHGAVYCLDGSFLDRATQEIGKERLKKYIRGE